MNNDYTNLNTVTLYKTPQFNNTDTLLFSSLNDRDIYFNTLGDDNILHLTEFTDLYEGRNFVLPYNYLDLKKYNTMRLYYNDGLGHEQTYFCNVDDYIYVSTNSCIPVYRIDYFLTFGYLLYNKNINIITDRRTVPENEINRDMKSDALQVPRLHYKKYNSWNYDIDDEIYYIAFLNKTSGGVGKNGINCSIGFYEDVNRTIYKEIDNYTIGCYLAFVPKANLSDLLNNEPQEYIEKIIEWNVPRQEWGDFTTTEVNNVHYVTSDWKIEYNSDFRQVPIKYIDSDIFKELTYLDTKYDIQPTHDKKVMNWLNCKGCVIQGFEFDFKDFDDDDFVIPLNDSDNAGLHSTIFLYNIFGYTFAYPLGYKGEKINLDYMIKWQSAKDFSYCSNYTNTLAYKQQLEYNNQSIINANRVAGLESYYANQLLANANEELDLSKRQTANSYGSQLSSMNTSYKNSLVNSQLTINELNNQGSIKTPIAGITYLAGVVTGQSQTANISRQNQYDATLLLSRNNANALANQTLYLDIQRQLNYEDIEIKKRASALNAGYKSDMASATRDNAIANIAISNKYNNAQPNAYKTTDFTQYTSFFYIFGIDTDNDTNFRIVDNIRNHYNVLGTNVGYIEKWRPSFRKGLYFDYIIGSVIDNKNELFIDIEPSIYVQLINRIEQGLRMWYTDTISWFGDVLIDNTYTGNPEINLGLSPEEKLELENEINEKIYVDLDSKEDILSYINTSQHTANEKTYMVWYVNEFAWGTQVIDNDKKARIASEVFYLDTDYSHDLVKIINKIKEWKFLTIYEIQFAIDTANQLNEGE